MKEGRRRGRRWGAKKKREKEKGGVWGRKEEGVHFNLPDVISLLTLLAIQCYLVYLLPTVFFSHQQLQIV